ncbi:MAG: serine/threonine protein kinase, partial [Rhodothermales bacterium]|nr:serine/threonine protein kinase [Rhodothermales bacterium]
MPSLVNSTVSHYEILAELGRGGMGIVYKARDVRLDRLAALKFLAPQWTQDKLAKERFVREAQSAAATEHTNICNVYEIDETDDGQLFIAMAYYEGQTLKQIIAEGPVDLGDALLFAAQTAEGLGRAHEKGVVHRDVKPGNIIVVENKTVKVLDFGIAKLSGSAELTQTGSTVGTVAY